MLAGDDILKIDDILKKQVHETHVFLAHRIDKQKLESSLRKGGNVTQL